VRFAKELKKHLVVHSRNSHPDTIKILENEDAKSVLLHMFGGKEQMKQVIENKWYISINYLVTRSKDYKKIARDTPLENICLETDAPWNGIQKVKEELKENEIIFKQNKETNLITLRNDPTTIRLTAQKIAEVKGIPFQEVWKKCGENAKKFFGLEI
ncbi:MAG TPA: TatD family hydrolase, partial [archaeon]|nr:TatD family hydrolase [archaeon]